METKKQLRKQLDEEISKEFEYYKEIFDIEKIVEDGEKQKEMAILTLDKIKKRIRQRYQHWLIQIIKKS